MYPEVKFVNRNRWEMKPVDSPARTSNPRLTRVGSMRISMRFYFLNPACQLSTLPSQPGTGIELREYYLVVFENKFNSPVRPPAFFCATGFSAGPASRLTNWVRLFPSGVADWTGLPSINALCTES